jgi:hypothetical protein
MTASRPGCSACGRAPLVGERVHALGSGRDERLLCDLCMKSSPPRAAEEARVERVHASARPLNVKRAA